MKEFNARSHIVAIKPSGNVLSYEAVEQLNILPNNWVDVLTGEAFTKDDIITIQVFRRSRYLEAVAVFRRSRRI